MHRIASCLILLALFAGGPVGEQEGLFCHVASSNHSTSAPTLPDDFYLESEVPGTTSHEPLAVQALPDGRLIVAEKRGLIYTVENGIRLSTPFLDIEEEVLNQADRGLLGLVIDPNSVSNGLKPER